MSGSACPACGHGRRREVAYPHPRSALFTGLRISVCESCGFGSVDRAIEPTQLRNYYEREYGALSGRDRRPEPAAYFADMKVMFKPQRSLSQLRLARQYLAAPPASILDVGAGFGTTLHFAKQEFWPEATLHAVEPDLSMAAYLQHIGAEMLPDLDQARPGAYDLIVASHVLEHYQASEIGSILQRLHALLAPGGIIVAEVPNSDFSAYPRIDERSHEPHLLFFSLPSMRAMFQAAGFDIRFASTIGALHSRGPMIDFADKVRRKLSPAKSEYGKHRAAIRLAAAAAGP